MAGAPSLKIMHFIKTCNDFTKAIETPIRKTGHHCFPHVIRSTKFFGPSHIAILYICASVQKLHLFKHFMPLPTVLHNYP